MPQPESYQDANSAQILWRQICDKAVNALQLCPEEQHRAGFPQRLQVSGSAPIGAAPGGTAARPEAVKQVLTCLRKSDSLFLKVLVMHSALKLKCPCLPWAAIGFMIFKLFICMQSSWPYFSHLPAQSEVGHTDMGMDTHTAQGVCSSWPFPSDFLCTGGVLLTVGL